MSTESIAFDRAAEFYDETRGFPPGEDVNVGELIARTGNFTDKFRVLEVGVGTGRIALPTSAHVGQYIGIDLAVPMMNKLREKSGSDHINVIQGDITYLPFASDQFDAVVATHVFHLIPTWEMALKEVQRVLKPGGVLLNCFNNRHENDARDPLWNVWNATIPEERRRPVGANIQLNPDFLQHAGWQLIEKDSHQYQSTTTVTLFLSQLKRRVWSRLWRMDQDDIERGITALEAYIAENIDDPDAPITEYGAFTAEVFVPAD